MSTITTSDGAEIYYKELGPGPSGHVLTRLATDFTEDLKKIDVPALVLHGEDDQIVRVKDSAVKSARLIKGAKEIYYPGAPHGLTATHQDQVNADLLAFLRSQLFGFCDAGLSNPRRLERPAAGIGPVNSCDNLWRE
jgi:pimeloyl-ACP methyl ester carboxylesterase